MLRSDLKAREIIEYLCREGDDAWQTNVMALRCHVHRILEAWSKDRKQEIVDRSSKKGLQLIDHAVFGDYDFVLWKTAVVREIDLTGEMYLVSINSEQHDPADVATQHTRFPGTSLRHLPVRDLIEVLQSWIEEHGRLGIGTVEAGKLGAYRRILSRYFKVEPFDPEHADLSGFWIDTQIA